MCKMQLSYMRYRSSHLSPVGFQLHHASEARARPGVTGVGCRGRTRSQTPVNKEDVFSHSPLQTKESKEKIWDFRAVIRNSRVLLLQMTLTLLECRRFTFGSDLM